MKKIIIISCLSHLLIACSVIAQKKENLPLLTEDAKVEVVENLIFAHTSNSTYVFEKKGKHSYKLLVYVTFPCVSEDMPYISKEGNDTILFEVNFKNHGRWYKKELGHAKAQKNKIAWIKKEYP